MIAPVNPDHAEHRALTTAVDFARRAHVPLTVIVVGVGHHGAEEDLAATIMPIDDLDVELEVLPRGAGTAGTLCDHVDSQPDSLVCMPTHAPGGLREALFHPTSSEVLARIRRPVVLVGPDCRTSPSWNEIAVFVDGSRASEPETRFATDLARSLELPLTFLRVLQPSDTAGNTDITEDADLRHHAAAAIRSGHHVTWDARHHRSPARGTSTGCPTDRRSSRCSEPTAPVLPLDHGLEDAVGDPAGTNGSVVRSALRSAAMDA